jgi:hypothetical protein
VLVGRADGKVEQLGEFILVRHGYFHAFTNSTSAEA